MADQKTMKPFDASTGNGATSARSASAGKRRTRVDHGLRMISIRAHPAW